MMLTEPTAAVSRGCWGRCYRSSLVLALWPHLPCRELLVTLPLTLQVHGVPTLSKRPRVCYRAGAKHGKWVLCCRHYKNAHFHHHEQELDVCIQPPPPLLLMLCETLLEAKHTFSLLFCSFLPRPWVNLTRNRLAMDSGKCSFKTSSNLQFKERFRGWMRSWEKWLVVAIAGIWMKRNGDLDEDDIHGGVESTQI
jgi:hypothetical protein